MNKYRIRKTVEAMNVNEAIKKEPKTPIEEIYLLEEEASIGVGFNKKYV